MPSTSIISDTKSPSGEITGVLIPDVPRFGKFSGFTAGMNFFTLSTIADLEIELRNSLDTREMKSGFRRSFFVLPVTISVIFERAVEISVIKLSYASGESTGTAFGPISVSPLALLIQCGSKNGNCVYLGTV